MWTFIKSLFYLIIAAVLVAAAAIGWLLLVPVTESGVGSRLRAGCLVAMGAQAFDRANRPGRRQPAEIAYADCTCMAADMIRALGTPVAASAADAVRLKANETLGARFSGDRRAARNALLDREAQSAVAFGLKSVQACQKQRQDGG